MVQPTHQIFVPQAKHIPATANAITTAADGADKQPKEWRDLFGTARLTRHRNHCRALGAQEAQETQKECDTSAPMKDHTRLLLQYCAEASGGLDEGEAIRQQHAVDIADSRPPLALTLTLGRHWR
jgi:hypothetical protein